MDPSEPHLGEPALFGLEREGIRMIIKNIGGPTLNQIAICAASPLSPLYNNCKGRIPIPLGTRVKGVLQRRELVYLLASVDKDISDLLRLPPRERHGARITPNESIVKGRQLPGVAYIRDAPLTYVTGTRNGEARPVVADTKADCNRVRCEPIPTNTRDSKPS